MEKTKEVKHTPGPWQVAIPHEWRQGILDAEGLLIAEVHQWKDIMNMEENARLIAAAPDLLQAAKIAQRHIEWLAEKELAGDKPMENLLQSVNSTLKAALARAEKG